MHHETWFLKIIEFLNLLPAAVFCYLPMKHQLKYSRLSILLLCTALFVLYAPAASWLSLYLNTDTNTILLPSLVIFFFLYYKTVKTDLSRTLSVYLNACAVLSFPSVFAYMFDAYLHPSSGAADFSSEAGIFQFAVSALLVLALSYPLHHYFSWMLDSLNFPKVWYSIMILPAMLLLFNLMMTPYSYQTLYTGRIMLMFPWLEAILFFLLLFLYILFYHMSIVISEHAKQEEEVRFLEIQAGQYEALQNHIQQTRRLRHDFRHLVHGMIGLADNGELDPLRARLHEYEQELDSNTPVSFCCNAALNALFNYYREMASSEQIDLDWNIALPETLTISELDLCSLLGNLIENAIAGCKTVPDTKRFFSLSIAVQNTSCLYIVSTNSFDGIVKKNPAGYLSTKRDGEGIGLFSIKTIAEKYNGIAQISNSGSEFYVNIMLRI